MQETESQETSGLFEICCLDKHLHKVAIRLLFPVFPVIQATLHLVSARIYYFVVSAWKWPTSAKYRVQDAQTKTTKALQAQWKMCKKNPAYMKSLQVQTKNKTRILFPTISGTRCPKHVMPYIDGPNGPKCFWSLSNEELMLNTIWEKFEVFCKANLMR